MKKLIGQLSKNYGGCLLRYLLFEECDNFKDQVYFSLLVEKRDETEYDFKMVRDFTNKRTEAEKMLKRVCAGKVTPVGLPYVIEDYVIGQYLLTS